MKVKVKVRGVKVVGRSGVWVKIGTTLSLVQGVFHIFLINSTASVHKYSLVQEYTIFSFVHHVEINHIFFLYVPQKYIILPPKQIIFSFILGLTIYYTISTIFSPPLLLYQLHIKTRVNSKLSIFLLDKENRLILQFWTVHKNQTISKYGKFYLNTNLTHQSTNTTYTTFSFSFILLTEN